MAYTPPAGGAIGFEMESLYAIPDGAAMEFEMDPLFFHAIESISVSQSVVGGANFVLSVSDAISASSSSAVDPAIAVWAIDSMSISDAFSVNGIFGVSLSDTINASESAVGSMVAIISVSESLSVSDVVSPSALISVAVEDTITAGVLMLLNGEVYQGVAVNAKTFAASRYESFNFNSFAKFNGQYFALSNDGIHILSGSTDAGEPIKSRVTTGNIKVAGNRQARVEDAYLICKNDGNVIVRVFANGQKYDYKLTKTSDFYDESRVKLGKGRKSAMWQFELETEGESTFDIESVKIYPLALSRRV